MDKSSHRLANGAEAMLALTESERNDPLIQEWIRQRREYYALLPQLQNDPRYRDRYVAILNGEVIDDDADELELMHRISKNNPQTVVFVGAASGEVRTVEMPSWELER
jgi:hypothetical protein